LSSYHFVEFSTIFVDVELGWKNTFRHLSIRNVQKPPPIPTSTQSRGVNPSPRLKFVKDESFETAEAMNRLLQDPRVQQDLD